MTNLLPLPELQFFSNDGVPLAGGSVATYIPNTTTPKTTWQDQNQVTANANPIVLDSAGRCIVFGSGQYRFIVKDSLGNQIYDQLSIAGLPDSAISAAMLPVVGAATTATALSLLGVPAYVNTAVSNISLITGPTGPAGITGATGATGPTGPTGPAGSPVVSTVFTNVYDVTTSRRSGTVYTNSTGKPMFVRAVLTTDGANPVNSVFIIAGNMPPDAGLLIADGIVPAGATYQIFGPSGGNPLFWYETY